MSINYKLKILINISIGLFVIVTVLPVKLNYSSLAIILILLSSLVYYFVEKPKINKEVLLLTIPFIVYCFGLINTQDFDYGVKVLSKSLSFLIFPIVFSLISKNQVVNTRWILIAFLIALAVTNVYLIYLFIYYFNLGEKFSRLLSNTIYHSTYLGMYNITAFWLAYFAFKGKRKYWIIICAFFLISAVFCSSRIVSIIALFSVSVSYTHLTLPTTPYV